MEPGRRTIYFLLGMGIGLLLPNLLTWLLGLSPSRANNIAFVLVGFGLAVALGRAFRQLDRRD
jgi:uncharacterized membrane protein YuzA (DUF378 family)